MAQGADTSAFFVPRNVQVLVAVSVFSEVLSEAQRSRTEPLTAELRTAFTSRR